MTPSYAELVAAIRREGEGIVSAGRVDIDAKVVTCGDWTMRELLVHVGRVFHRAADLVGQRRMTQLDFPPEPGDGVDPVDYLAEALDELVTALGTADAESPAWNWSEQPQVAMFWARRMAHEAAVHRYDAQRAHGLAQPIDADLAHDAMDELVDLLLPRIVERDQPDLPVGVYAFAATDDGEWVVRTGEDGVERLATAKHADVTVTGPGSSVLLAAYGRVKWASLETSGDDALLSAWTAAFRF